MDDSKFLSVFARLQSRDKVVLCEAVQQLVDFLARAQTANSAEERDYALARLTKGLASALHEVKVGFSMALTALLRKFQAIDPATIYHTYKSFDQSISSTHCLKLGQITLISCILRGRPGLRNKEVEKDLAELFQQRKEMAESISEVILLSPNAQKLTQGLADTANVNYLRLTYEQQSPNSEVVAQAIKAKTTILEGSLTALPRLHSVWSPVLDSAYHAGKLASLWKHFVETGIQASDKHKKKVKFVSLGLSLLAQVLTRQPLLLGAALTPLFVKNWQEQCTHKNSRLHDQANSVKTAMYTALTSQVEEDCSDIATAVLAMAKVVHGSEILIRLTEFLAGKLKPGEARGFCEGISESGNEQLIACLLNKLCKREEVDLRSFSTEMLLRQVVLSPANVGLKSKLIDALAGQKLDEVLSALEFWLQFKSQISIDFRKVGKKVLKRIQFLVQSAGEEEMVSPKKRKRSSDGLFTRTQLQTLCKLAVLQLIGSTHNPECPQTEVMALISVVEKLSSVDLPKSETAAETALFDCILKCTSDSLLREPTKSAFKQFVNELPDTYAEKLAGILSWTKPTAPSRPDPKDVLGDDIELDGAEALDTVLATTTPQTSEYTETDILRASDLAEVIIKKSSVQKHLVLIGKSLALGMRKGTDNVKNRFRALLQKFSKGTISVSEDSFADYLDLLSLIFSLNRKDGSTFASTRALAVALCKKLADYNPIDTSDLLNKVLTTALEKHASKAAFEQLKQILGQVPKCCTAEVFEALAAGVVSPATHFIQVQSLELLKVAAKKQPTPQSVLKSLIKHTRKVLKGPLTSKQAHNDLKLLLSTLLTACKKAEFTHRRLQRICEKVRAKCEGVMGVLNVVVELQKHIHEAESKA